MSKIKAIETRYAGCRFRSRLEARWAVAFDRLEIEWEYEPEGFECSWRLLGDSLRAADKIPYLPDFWLPAHDVFVEVKGELADDECTRLLNIAASLSSPNGGCGGGHDLVVLGPVPRDLLTVPVRLHMHKGDLIASPFTLSQHDNPCWGAKVANDMHGITGDRAWRPAEVSALLLRGTEGLDGRPWSRWASAHDAARSARFEHGEQGAPRARHRRSR